MELSILIITGALTITTAFMVIVSRNTVHSALWMIASFFCMAVLMVMQHAQFLAVLQIIVYAGAIMMFIIYAIMMLNLRHDQAGPSGAPKTKAFGLALLIVLFMVMLLMGLGRSIHAVKGPVDDAFMEKFGHMNVISRYLFSDYLLPFEVVSILLTAGVVGAVVLARRRGPKP